MIYSCFSCPNTDGNSSAPKIFTLLTNEHRYSGCDSSRGLPPHTHTHYLKGFENEEMILIKEVMANTHAQTNTHTHPFQFSLSGSVAPTYTVGKIPASWCLL